VSTTPALTVFTRMPRGPNSCASARTSDSSAAFEAPIETVARHRAGRTQARHRDDPSPVLHQWQRALREQVDGKRVCLEAPAPVLESHVHDRLQHAGCGVLTTISTRSKCLPNSAKISSTDSGTPTLPWIVTARRPSARISPGERFGLVVAVVVVDRDVRSALRKLLRDGAADAACGARDERHLTT